MAELFVGGTAGLGWNYCQVAGDAVTGAGRRAAAHPVSTADLHSELKTSVWRMHFCDMPFKG